MITVNNKEYRNLVEQVGYLTNRVDEHYERDRVLADYGIRVVGSVNSVNDLPNPLTYDGLYGDAYTVGTGAPYDFYIFTRPLQGETENRWLDLGQLAIQGPQGEQGPEGPVGPQGESTQWYVGQGVPYLEANLNSMYFDTTTANIYQKQEGQWIMVANIKGNTGAQGPQGPQGEPGPKGEQGIQGENGVPGDAVNIVGILTSASMLPDPDTVSRDSAYVVEDGTGQWLYFITGTDTLIWDKVPFENGTTVLVGGNPVQTFDADSKVSKITSTTQYLRVYANYAGTDKSPIVATTPGLAVDASDRIASYGPSGRSATSIVNAHLMTGTPVYNYDAANKKYVDETVAAMGDTKVNSDDRTNRIYGTESTGNQAAMYWSWAAEGNSFPRRGSGGSLSVGNPTLDQHAATKAYVDNAIANAPHILTCTHLLTEGSDALNVLQAMQMMPIAGDRKYTFDVVPLDSSHPNAGVIFTSGSSSTVYRNIEVFFTGNSGGPIGLMKLTQTNGTVTYSSLQTGTAVANSGGNVMLVITGAPTEALTTA